MIHPLHATQQLSGPTTTQLRLRRPSLLKLQAHLLVMAMPFLAVRKPRKLALYEVH